MVLTGYNTDIEHSGTTYHVQTEDKGRSNPVVESLVYARGEILYSRRTPYQDLVEQEVDKEAIAALMEKQHRAIVDAVANGGLDRLNAADDQVASGEDTTITHGQDEKASAGEEEPTLDQVILDYLEAQRGRAHLILRATGDHDFEYGDTTKVSVTAVDSHAQDAQAGVRISVLFKSTADPRRLVLVEGETDDSGCFTAEAAVPDFNGGTSAVVIIAESDLGQSEIKHLVHR